MCVCVYQLVYACDRKQEIYSLSWNQTDLSKFMISGAQYGGPLGKERRKGTDLCILQSSINVFVL